MVVALIDMDYFFGACEELRHHELKGKPFVVGTSPEKDKMKGVVQTANYEARKYGIKSGISTVQAYRLYKDLIYLQEDYDYYESVSKKIFALLLSYHKPVEQMSIDEFAIDFGKDTSYHEAELLAMEFKERINKEIGLPCTVGISYGKVFAKMVCDSAKPNGFKTVKEEDIWNFLEDKSVGELPGIGVKTEEKLKEMGIAKIGELAKVNPLVLEEKFGSFGIEMHELANGIDKSKVIERYEVLSISRESTLEEPTKDLGKIKSKLKELSEDVKKEIDKNGYVFKTIGVKVRYSDFSGAIKNKSMERYSNSGELIFETACKLIELLVEGKEVRKVGVRVSSFSGGPGQRKLF
ncbi:MAG: DNA polymerase IV [Candidatus Micrarchaeaceae archaeon]